jgi:hypothetical protein
MAQSEYLARLVAKVKRMLHERGGVVTEADVRAAVVKARAEAGGVGKAKAAAAKGKDGDGKSSEPGKGKAKDDTPAVPAAAAKLPVPLVVNTVKKSVGLDDDDNGSDGGEQDIPGDAFAIEDSYEDQIDDLRLAVQSTYGDSYRVFGTFDNYAIIYQLQGDGSDPDFFHVAYTIGDDDAITLGVRTPVEQNVSFAPVKAEEMAALEALLSAEWTEDVRAEDAPVMLAAGVVDKPWDGSAGRFPDAESYCRAALIDRNPAGKPKSKALCSLPVREPSGELNKNALGPAAAAINGARSPLTATGAEKSAAKAKLRGLYKQAGMDAPDSIKAEDTPAHAAPAAPTAAAVRLGDADRQMVTLSAIRLDEGRGLPAWQQLHRIGSHAIEHAVAGKIELTRQMGDTMIRNHRANVLRRPVPLDAKHTTDEGGAALAWLKDVRWGREGEGLPDAPEPSGTGDVLYGRFDYTDLGQPQLSGEHYKCISPQYDRDYVDKQTGRHYGPTITAVAATNNPFLRLRTIQGEPAPEPVLLEDGLRGTHQPSQNQSISAEESDMSDAEKVQLQEVTTKLAEMQAALAEERQQRHRETVHAWAKEQISINGTPPAVVNVAERILLACSPRADGVVQLSDADPEQKVNLYEAIKGLVEAVPRVSLQSRTYSSGQRPPNVTLDEGDADKQLGSAVDFVVQDILGLKTATPAAAAANGNGTHA